MSSGQKLTPDGPVTKRPPNAGKLKKEHWHKHVKGIAVLQADGRAISAGISVEKYNQMTAEYFKVQTIDHVRKACRVNWDTAAKYINTGDPKRNMPAIKERYILAQRKVQARQERTWANAATEWKDMIYAFKALANQALREIADGKPLKKGEVPDKARFLAMMKNDPEKFGTLLSRMMRDESFAFGGPDVRAAVQHSVQGVIETWSAEEMHIYITTGKRPDRLLGVLVHKAEAPVAALPAGKPAKPDDG